MAGMNGMPQTLQAQSDTAAGTMHGAYVLSPLSSIQNPQNYDTNITYNTAASSHGTSQTLLAPQAPPPKQWISIWLRSRVVVPFLVATVSLIVVITVLAVLSHNMKGLCRIDPGASNKKWSKLVPGFDFSISITWTSIPSLTFTLYNLAFAAIVKEAGKRQPYVELYSDNPNGENGAPASQSIALDYASVLPIVAPFKATRRGHLSLGFSFAAVGLSTIFLVAISSNLLYNENTKFVRDIAMMQNVTFNEDGLGPQSSLSDVFGIVSDSLIYTGTTTPGPGLNASITPVEYKVGQPGIGTSGNVTIPVKAYSAKLDCDVLDSTNSQLYRSSTGDLFYSAQDRGCNITREPTGLQLVPYTREYAQTFAYMNCTQKEAYGRTVVVVARNLEDSKSRLTDIVIVSCIARYYDLAGKVTIERDRSQRDAVRVVNFTETSRTMRTEAPLYAGLFQTMLQQPRYIDPTSVTSASAFGALLLSFSKKVANGTDYLSGVNIKRAAETLFPAGFAVTAQLNMYSPSKERTLVGKWHTEEERLHVSPPIAMFLGILLLCAFVAVVWVYVYAKRHNSIQYEEPQGLLGSAVLLRGSDLMRRVEALPAEQYGGRVGEALMAEIEDESPQRGWTFVHWDVPQWARIINTKFARRRTRWWKAWG